MVAVEIRDGQVISVGDMDGAPNVISDPEIINYPARYTDSIITPGEIPHALDSFVPYNPTVHQHYGSSNPPVSHP
jgi:hypothetical protein